VFTETRDGVIRCSSQDARVARAERETPFAPNRPKASVAQPKREPPSFVSENRSRPLFEYAIAVFSLHFNVSVSMRSVSRDARLAEMRRPFP
jgi:hypothetical protein